jgi:type IV pilus assembly protein PilY1
MRIRFLGSLVALVLVLVAGWPVRAEAQTDDITSPRPVVLLGIDTSGSMEYLPDNSLPTCGDGTDEYNRWTVAIEALTGTFSAYSCTDLDRAVAFPGQIDETYYLHHYRANGPQLPNGVLDSYRERIKFGLMTFDSWGGGPTYPDPDGAERDLDGMYSYGHDHRFVCEDLLDGWDGVPDCVGWDYAWDAGARRACDMPAPSFGCPALKDVLGGIISVGVSDLQPQIDLVNAAIQADLLQIRPFGATPLAALLDDMHFYFARNTDVLGGGGGADDEADDDDVADDHGMGSQTGEDAFATCREKFGILFTDGVANVDGRPFCTDFPQGSGLWGAYGCECPYDTAPEQAELLADDDIPVFVIGYAVEAGTPLDRLHARRALWEIAQSGGTAEPCDPLCGVDDVLCHVNLCGGDVNCLNPPTCPTLLNPATNTYHVGAIITDCDPTDPAACRAEVAGAFARIFDAIGNGSTSRTLPAHSMSTAGGGAGSAMDEFTGRFTVSAGYPWEGHLGRARWECIAGALVPRAYSAATDSFDGILDGAGARDIYTFDPTGDNPPVDSPLVLRNTLTAAGGVTVPFTKAAGLPFQYFGVTDDAERNAVIDFVRADAGDRLTRRLGDIFHSGPVVHPVPEPRFGSASYTGFVTKMTTAPTKRVPVVFVGTNDGMLHAFNAMPDAVDGAGDELWAFVPPFHLENLVAQMPATHQFYMDGAISVADVLPNFLRGTTPVADEWRTVVVAGMRQGGNAYVALDVTDSLNTTAPPDPPTMLWQITGPEFGLSYGGPQIARVLVQVGAGPDVEERAVALLVGGLGVLADPDNPCDRQARGLPSRPDVSGQQINDQVRCWGDTGRYLRIVDLISGNTIQEFGPSNYGGGASQLFPIDSPLVGTPVVYLQGFDTTMTEAFIPDADGTLWRLQTHSTDPADWTLEIFHDLYHDEDWDERQPAFEQPALTTDAEERIVVLFGSGDPDSLVADVPDMNRVVSVAERRIVDADGVETGFEPLLNWTLDLPDDDEKVTGPITVTDEIAYFTTYVPGQPTLADACVQGFARIWGVDYLCRGDPDCTAGDSDDPPFPRLMLDTDDDPSNGNEDAAPDQGGAALDLPPGTVLFGLQAVRRPSCVVIASVADPIYGGMRDQITSVTPAEWELVAQLPDAAGGFVPAGGNAGLSDGTIEIRQASRITRTRIDSWGALVE